MDCYDRIKDLCDKNGIAVTALETKLGFGRGSIGKMRTAKSVSSDRVRKIADYFEVPVQYLLTGKRTEEDVFYRIAMNRILMEMYNALDHGRKKQVDRFIEILYLEMKKEKASPTVSQMTS